MKRKLLLTNIILAFANICLAQIAPAPTDFLCDAVIYQESFENGLPLGWNGLMADSAKLGGLNEGWILDRDMTFSANTGPIGAAEGDFYVYCDGSGPIARGATATLLSPVINAGSFNGPALFFDLNMFGESGVLSVNIISKGSKKQMLGPVSGAMPGGIHTADQWEEIFIDLSTYRNKDIQIEFVAMKPSNAAIGDIAVDNIRLCASSNAIPTMSEWGVMIVLFLLMIFAVVSLKNSSITTLRT